MSDLNIQQPAVNKSASGSSQELSSDLAQQSMPVLKPNPAVKKTDYELLNADPQQTASVNAVIENYLEQLLIEATELELITPAASLLVEPQQAVSHKTTTPGFEDLIGQQCVNNPLPTLNWQQHCGVECLLFDVQGLKLAVPLIHLGGVTKVDQDLTPIPGQASWCLGVYRYHEQSVVVVDSAQYLMPERCPKGVSLAPRYIIKLANQPWALTCQGIVSTHAFIHKEIKWRGEKSKRQWLAGTIISEMCALLDINGLLNSLQEKYWQGFISADKESSS